METTANLHESGHRTENPGQALTRSHDSGSTVLAREPKFQRFYAGCQRMSIALNFLLGNAQGRQTIFRFRQRSSGRFMLSIKTDFTLIKPCDLRLESVEIGSCLV